MGSAATWAPIEPTQRRVASAMEGVYISMKKIESFFLMMSMSWNFSDRRLLFVAHWHRKQRGIGMRPAQACDVSNESDKNVRTAHPCISLAVCEDIATYQLDHRVAGVMPRESVAVCCGDRLPTHRCSVSAPFGHLNVKWGYGRVGLSRFRDCRKITSNICNSNWRAAGIL